MKRLALLIVMVVVAAGLFSACSIPSFRVKAGLQVITNDIPASVYLDNKLLDKTPYINKELKPGEYTLELRPENPSLATYQTKISLKNGLLTVVMWKPGNRPETSGGVIYEMEPLRNRKATELALTTIPDGAIVTVDGQAKGFAPVTVEGVSPGQHDYEISLPSYETQKHSINALEGYRMNVLIKLAKQDLSTFSATSPSTSATAAASPTPLPSPSPIFAASPIASSAASRAATSSAKTATGSPTTTTTQTAPIPRPKVRIKSTGYMQNGQEVLRVRDAAGAAGKEIGFVPVGSEYPLTEDNTNGWYKISFQNQMGWVSGQYVDVLK